MFTIGSIRATQNLCETSLKDNSKSAKSKQNLIRKVVVVVTHFIGNDYLICDQKVQAVFITDMGFLAKSGVAFLQTSICFRRILVSFKPRRSWTNNFLS